VIFSTVIFFSMIMQSKSIRYKAIISSDWSECLAPGGPFDLISFNYPELTPRLETIFKQYTGNLISLGEAARQIKELLPNPIAENQMDAYLDHCFATYPGVPELIQWCLNRDILFMINTTGMTGYFQRILAKGLLPEIPLLSAHPLIRYPKKNSDPVHIYSLFEIEDKAKNTAAAIKAHQIPPNKIIIMGDSGGDGPHFEWGAKVNAFLIGSMTKPSLENYCLTRNIKINFKFGSAYAPGQDRDLKKEMQVNFMGLSPCIKEVLV
jgi:2-hydroxy-3-keto-5-methylthiopentenyl-1-phosphate phosphatase